MLRQSIILGTMLTCATLAGCSGSDATSNSQHVATQPVGLRHITTPIFGCQSNDVIDRINQLDAEGDKAAALDYIRLNISSGDCAEFSAGETVYLEDATFTGLMKVRPAGSTTSYWTVSSVVGK